MPNFISSLKRKRSHHKRIVPIEMPPPPSSLLPLGESEKDEAPLRKCESVGCGGEVPRGVSWGRCLECSRKRWEGRVMFVPKRVARVRFAVEESDKEEEAEQESSEEESSSEEGGEGGEDEEDENATTRGWDSDLSDLTDSDSEDVADVEAALAIPPSDPLSGVSSDAEGEGSIDVPLSALPLRTGIKLRFPIETIQKALSGHRVCSRKTCNVILPLTEKGTRCESCRAYMRTYGNPRAREEEGEGQDWWMAYAHLYPRPCSDRECRNVLPTSLDWPSSLCEACCRKGALSEDEEEDPSSDRAIAKVRSALLLPDHVETDSLG
jgi:hypothetical protein